MFIHLGGDTLVSSKSIIALISLENCHNPGTFLKKIENAGMVEKLNSPSYKSLVITADKIYMSPISTMTLKKRADFVNNL